MESEIAATYGNRLRVRVCGLCFQGDALLMVNHNFYEHDFWAPPGGGLQFEEDCETALAREIMEETGLRVEARGLHFVCELYRPPLHAVELFFETRLIGGNLHHGSDPETSHAVIREVKWMTEKELFRLPERELHGIFRLVEDFTSLRALGGYHKM